MLWMCSTCWYLHCEEHLELLHSAGVGTVLLNTVYFIIIHSN